MASDPRLAWNLGAESMNTKVLTAHVPLCFVKKVDQIAARLERSYGRIIKQALLAWIDQEWTRKALSLRLYDFPALVDRPDRRITVPAGGGYRHA